MINYNYNNHVIMGFDVSSSCIGWSVIKIIDDKISLLDSGYLKPIKEDNIIVRLAHTRNIIIDLIKKFNPNYIGIENIVSFMKGKSTAQTIIMLTTFNRMICLCAYDFLQKSPEMFSVMSIRHGLKVSKDLPKKEDMPELVAQHLGIKFPYEHGKKGKFKIENYDRADGIAVGLYYAFLLLNKIKRKKI